MTPLLRRAAFVSVALLVCVFSALPHQHESLFDVWQTQGVEQIDTCSNGAATHLEAAQPVHPHPCAACLRQHSVADLRLVPLFTVRLAPVATVASAATNANSAFVDFASSRGPPV